MRLAGTRKKTIASSIQKPKELEGFQEEEESTTKDVSYLLSKLKKVCREKGGMNYYQFLIDPGSFSHTIENIFHFSFLVKVRHMYVCTCTYIHTTVLSHIHVYYMHTLYSDTYIYI